MPFVVLFICSFSTGGKEEETGEGGFEGGSVVQEKGREISVVDRRGERAGTTWKNHPVTTVQACIGVSVHGYTGITSHSASFKQINPVLHRFLQKPSNCFCRIFFTAVTFLHTFPNDICYMS